jgi:hemoglobin
MQVIHGQGWRRIAGIALLSAWLSGAAAETLFEELGGEPVLKKAVDEFMVVMLADDRINFAFAQSDLAIFKARLYAQLCDLAKGPCRYEGRSMAAAHEKLAINNAQFNALTEDLYVALDRAGVAFRTQNKLVALLAPMQRDIVKKGAKPTLGPATSPATGQAR